MRFIEDPVYVHADFDEWKPCLLSRSESDPLIWQCYRRVPPGVHHYFFTIAGHPEIAKDHPKMKEIVKTNVLDFQVQDDYFEERMS